jgi:hypothetical protein
MSNEDRAKHCIKNECSLDAFKKRGMFRITIISFEMVLSSWML